MALIEKLIITLPEFEPEHDEPVLMCPQCGQTKDSRIIIDRRDPRGYKYTCRDCWKKGTSDEFIS